MKRDIAYISLLIVVAVIIHWIWFDFSSILTASDWNYIPNNVVNESFVSRGTWIPFSGFGSANIQIPFIFFMSIWAIIVKLGYSYDIATKLTFFVPIAILNFISPYLLSRKLFKNKLTSFTLALFYGTSIYGIENQAPIQFVYAIAPLLFLLLINSLDKPTLSNWLTFSILYSISIFYEVRIMYILTFVFLIYILFTRLKNLSNLHFSAEIISSSIVIILLNLFWLMPLFFGAGGSDIQAVANRGLFGNNLADITHAFALSPWYWTGETPNNKFIIQPVLWYLWLIPILSFYALLIDRRLEKQKTLLIFFSATSLIGIFLTKQSFQPFPNVYEWLYIHFPGFNLFRESSKFYLITAIGYFGMLGFLLSSLLEAKIKSSKLIYIFIVFLITLISITNSVPLINGKLGGLFVNRTESKEYITLNNYLLSQAKNSYFRTYWVPRDSHWGYYDMNNPAVSGIDAINGVWNQFISNHPTDLIQDNIVDIFNHNYSQDLFNISAIKYVIVPLRDTANDDDFFVYYDGGIKNINIRDWYVSALNNITFLKKIDVGTPDIAVYENENFKPYISTFSSLINLDSISSFDAKYNFFHNVINKDFYYVLNTDNLNSLANIKIKDLYDGVKINNITKNTINSGSLIDNNFSYKLYSLSSAGTAYATILNGNLNIYRASGTLIGNGFNKIENVDNLIGSLKVPSDTNTYLTVDGSLFKISLNEKTLIGNIKSNSILKVYTAGDNLVPNGSFENGLWQKNVGDCNNFDSNPELNMSISKDAIDGTNSLELDALRHIACVGTSVVANRGNYILSFYAQSPDQTQAKYNLSLDSSESSTSTSKYIPLDGINWSHSETLVQLPNATTTVGLTLYGLSSDQKTNVTTRYDNVSIKKLNIVGIVKLNQSDFYNENNLNSSSTNANFIYSNSLFNYINLVPNGSFENGLWQKNVGDCADYDNNPNIGMLIDHVNSTEGSSSLELEATRHFACTNTNVAVHGGLNYLFSFDYKSPNSALASYYLGFNDASSSHLSNDIAITDSKWHTYSTLINVPSGASGVSIVMYAKEKDKIINIINNYDNVSLIQVPDLLNSYYLEGTAINKKLNQPFSSSFELISPTKKLVHIKGATTGFFLAMSESWHPSWQLEMNNAKIHGFLSSWTPLSHPDKVPDDQHFELDGFLNGWYVDVHQLCEVEHVQGCTQNADGSYNLEMEIEFWPQRWFYVGLVVSGTSLAAVLSYLGYSGIMALRKRQQRRMAEQTLV